MQRLARSWSLPVLPPERNYGDYDLRGKLIISFPWGSAFGGLCESVADCVTVGAMGSLQCRFPSPEGLFQWACIFHALPPPAE